MDDEHIFSEPRYAHFLYNLSVKESPAAHSNPVALHWDEGNAHLRRWQAYGTLVASEDAVATFRRSLSTNSMGLKNGALLHSLAIALRVHGNHIGDLQLLIEAEGIHRAEIKYIQLEDHNRSGCEQGRVALYNSYITLAGVLYSKYSITGNTTQLDDAIAMNQAAMEIQASIAETATPVMAVNMASCLLLRYQAENDVASLYESLRYVT
jgi:hypothetical protein